MSEVPLYRRAYVGAYALLGVEYDPLATYRGISLTRNTLPL
jgi:hypothetical protein